MYAGPLEEFPGATQPSTATVMMLFLPNQLLQDTVQAMVALIPFNQGNQIVSHSYSKTTMLLSHFSSHLFFFGWQGGTLPLHVALLKLNVSANSDVSVFLLSSGKSTRESL